MQEEMRCASLFMTVVPTCAHIPTISKLPVSDHSPQHQDKRYGWETYFLETQILLESSVISNFTLSRIKGPKKENNIGIMN